MANTCLYVHGNHEPTDAQWWGSVRELTPPLGERKVAVSGKAETAMNVAELLVLLADAKPDAVVLLLPAYAGPTGADELASVEIPDKRWIRETHFCDGEPVAVLHHPDNQELVYGRNGAKDTYETERVVILSPEDTLDFENLNESSDTETVRSSANKLYEEALREQRMMVSTGILIPEEELRRRLSVGRKQFARLCDEGSVFGVDVEGAVYYPASLAVAGHNRARLHEVCRIIVPAQDARLDFLLSRRVSLGDRSPLEMLDADADYARLVFVAEAWAAEFSRTLVRLFEGIHETEPADVEPMYTAVSEIDPRKQVWERASTALLEHGYQWPLGPYPEARSFTTFIAHQNAGDPEPRPDACVQIVVDDEHVRIRVIFKEGVERYLETVPVGTLGSVVEAAKKVVARLRRR